MQSDRFNIRAIPDEISRAARETLKSPQYGHPAHVELAGGTGPCRQCLRTFEVEKERQFFSRTIRSTASIRTPLRAQSSFTKMPAKHIQTAENFLPLFVNSRSYWRDMRATDGSPPAKKLKTALPKKRSLRSSTIPPLNTFISATAKPAASSHTSREHETITAGAVRGPHPRSENVL